MINRRTFSLSTCAMISQGCSNSQREPIQTPLPLSAQAESKGLYYGAALRTSQLADPNFVKTLKAECGVLVPENALKWGALERQEGRPDFIDVDRILAVAKLDGKKLRGHTLAWYRSNPSWLSAALRRSSGIETLYQHITKTVSRYRGQFFEWDVVNEAIEPKDGEKDGLRNTEFLKIGGKNYIADCFHLAHEADPTAKLYYNEYGLEYKSGNSESRRNATLELLEYLLAAGAPVHALGIQSHIKIGNEIDTNRYRLFLQNVAALGLKISLTEFDVDDSNLNGSNAARDSDIKNYARKLLDIAFDQKSVIGIMTWGLTYKYNWIDELSPRKSGGKNRSLPFDTQFKRGAVWSAISESLSIAPLR